jgi:hypothetical protein
VQAVQPVPPNFFLEVKCRHIALVWKHHLLKPHEEEALPAGDDPDSVVAGIEDLEDDGSGSDSESDEDEEDEVEMQAVLQGGLTYEEAINKNIMKIGDFLKGL